MEFPNSNDEQSPLYNVLSTRIEDDEIHINASNKDSIEEVVTAIVNQEAFGDESKLNAVMFKGLPGTGKGYTAQWVRTKVSDILGEDIPMLAIGSLQTPEDVMNLYAQARQFAKEKGRCILWDDEVDKRGKRGETQDNAKEAVLNQLLIEMQGAEKNVGVTTVCCTNRPDKIDSAYRRGKRCGKEIIFDPLDKKGREHISRIDAFKRNHQFIFDKEDIGYVVSKTYGAVGADIAQLFTDAAAHTNLKLYRALQEISKELLFAENVDEAKVAERFEALGLANLSVNLAERAQGFAGEKEKFLQDKSNEDIKADDEYREKKLAERFARYMFKKLNPNPNPDDSDGKQSLEEPDEETPVTKWIKVDRDSIDHVLEHFVPSALKDMPFEETDFTFSSLGGMDAQIKYLKRIMENTVAQDKEGTTLLLHGPQGCGVTSLARAVAGEYGYNLIVLYGADQESKWVGEVKDRLLEINERAKASKPTVVVFDNLHYLAQNEGGYDQAHKQTATSALKQIIKPTKGVLYIATVDKPEMLSPSMRGLFKREVEINPPKETRDYQVVWETNLNKEYLPQKGEINIEELAQKSNSLTGGDINNICRGFAELGVEYSQAKLGKIIGAYTTGSRQGQIPKRTLSDMQLANMILE
jgi:SpoVK/Ycf46/Vps4 family AAA+-type ATPase